MHLNGSVWCNRGRWCIFCPRSSSWRGEGENHVRAVGELGTAELHDPLRVDYLIRTCTSYACMLIWTTSSRYNIYFVSQQVFHKKSAMDTRYNGHMPGCLYNWSHFTHCALHREISRRSGREHPRTGDGHRRSRTKLIFAGYEYISSSRPFCELWTQPTPRSNYPRDCPDPHTPQ